MMPKDRSRGEQGNFLTFVKILIKIERTSTDLICHNEK